jgi:hypothetical protein
MPEPLDDEPVVALVAVVPVAAGAALDVLVLLLLLPHAASPIASAAEARATRPTGLILPVTRSPFRQKLNGQP